MKRGVCPIHSLTLQNAIGRYVCRTEETFIYSASEKTYLCVSCLEDGLFGQHALEEAKLSHPDFFRPKFLEVANAV
jgi:hypothetical protein